MDYLNYLLAAVICFAGIYAGFFAALIAKEELKAGKKYFVVLQNLIFAIAAVSTVLVIRNVHVSIALLGFLVYLALVRHHSKDILAYIAFGMLLFLNSRYGNMFLMQSALVFLYGLPAGSLLALEMVKKKKSEIAVSIFARYIWFVVAALVLFMIF